MDASQVRRTRRIRRKAGVRKRIFGTGQKPRLSVYRSLRHIYVQLIDDLEGRTLAQANTREAGVEQGGNCEAAAKIGQTIAQRARELGVERVVFDRNGLRYHGRVRHLADAAREGGLKF